MSNRFINMMSLIRGIGCNNPDIVLIANAKFATVGSHLLSLHEQKERERKKDSNSGKHSIARKLI